MRFIKIVVKSIGAAVLFGLLSLFLYFTAVETGETSAENVSLANLFLLLFVFTTLIAALTQIWEENQPEEDNYLLARMRAAETSASAIDNDTLEDMRKLLQKVADSHQRTNTTLNLALENLNNRMDDLEAATLAKNTLLLNKLKQMQTAPKKSAASETEIPVDLNLNEIFNEDLAKTLADLEIMKDNKPKKR